MKLRNPIADCHLLAMKIILYNRRYQEAKARRIAKQK